MILKLTIIIPLFNEEDNLHRIENELKDFLEIASVPTCALFVNDGSTDKSQDLIASICERNKNFSFISLDKNYGLSTALKAGFDTVETELTGYMDADLQTSPKDFNLLLEHIENHALVTGVRTKRQDSFMRKLTSKIANSIRRLFTNDGMDDTGCPLKIFKTYYAKRLPMFKGLHRFLPAMILLQKGTIKQIPVSHFPRVAGKAKFGITNRFFGPLSDCFIYLWMRKKYINYGLKDYNKNLES